MRRGGATKSLRNSICLSCARDWRHRRLRKPLSLFCKFFRKNSDSLQFPRLSLYAYLNLNQLNHPEVSKFRFSPGQYGS
jgi:hypothetical protein